MKTAGIPAEYNPFHNGHQFQIEETRRRVGADYVIGVISGSFVQRGAPALLDKYTRARMALCHGAVLVFELPCVAALQSAEGFATGSVALLDALGVVDTGIRGCERADADPALFSHVTDLLAAEPDEYRQVLSDALREGVNYPSAREAAVRAYRNKHPAPDGSGDEKKTDALGRLLSEPNNILALEYARAIKKGGSSMGLCLIPRAQDAPRDGAARPENASSYASASSIRSILLEDPAGPSANDRDALLRAAIPADEQEAVLRAAVPTDEQEELLQAQAEHRCLCEDDFSDLLLYALTSNRAFLSGFGTDNPDLTRRIANLTEQFTSWTAFAELVKTKNQTYTAISRLLAQILLGIRRADIELAETYRYAPYARLLGFRKDAAPLLKEIQASASIPVLTRLAKDHPTLGEDEQRVLAFDIQAAGLYRQILQSKSGCRIKSEFRQPLIRV